MEKVRKEPDVFGGVRQGASERRQHRLPQYMTVLLITGDIVAIHAAYFVALWARFDFVWSMIPAEYLQPYRSFITIYSLVCIVIFSIFHLYKSIWRFAGYTELIRILGASFVTTVLHTVFITVFFRRMPLSYYGFGAILQFLMTSGIRFSYRFFVLCQASRRKKHIVQNRIMLIGAGESGKMLLRDLHSSSEINDRVMCLIDDDPNKWNRMMEGVPIVGGREYILEAADRYHIDKIFLTIPSASAEDKREILNICNETGCELKQLPGMYQLALGEITISSMREVSVEDLLGRDPVHADIAEVYSFIHDKVVLVTGGGGSIGSELCRQVAAHGPKQLILFDVYENNAYEIQMELKERYPQLQLEVLIGSVRDSRRVFQVFETYRPEIVYHAAAHKHVPLMEDSPNEAIKNNTIGTYKTAYAAMVHGCERFVLISTDKAVNPTNIMGASKRLCEMVIQGFDEKIKSGHAEEIPQLFTHGGDEDADKDGTGAVFRNVHTEFVAVRFGNVLGSNGSVIPLFKKQIERGGPVTVTHPDIIRYFMTIPEAVGLVMVAGTYAQGGEIFVLDMGEPVKIDTLARNLIRLSGYKPDVDIKIEYSGLRPGEKLYEEKLMAEEGMRTTKSKLIHIGNPVPFDTDEFFRQLEGLMKASYSNKENIREYVKEMVATYHENKAC